MCQVAVTWMSIQTSLIKNIFGKDKEEQQCHKEDSNISLLFFSLVRYVI